MGQVWSVAVIAASVLGATIVLTGAARRWLGARAILDRPVERSSHRVPVPRGGGLALVPVLVLGVLALMGIGLAPAGTPVILAAFAALALLSWRDDLGGLPVTLRLALQAVAVLAGVAVLPAAPITQGLLPPFWDHVVAALVWLWFVNLYNFMDGIDGITGVETVALGVGIALALGTAGAADGAAATALVAAAAGLGFLCWNWHPARIFLGDVGSVPLGYLMGWLLLSLAAGGLWAPALILPLYYTADATITLARRIRRGERFWQAHRQHFYQRALGRSGDHAAVARMILVGDAALVAMAVIGVTHPWAAVGGAVLVVATLLMLLERRGRYA